MKITVLLGGVSAERDVSLSSGLRIAVAPVKVADAKGMPAEGLKPDIRVEVRPEDELAHLEDAYKSLAKAGGGAGPRVASSLSSTNRAVRPRVNEAALVRMLRDGQSSDLETNSAAPREIEPVKQLIQDPALARALDLLKGLAVMQQFRPI